MMNKFFGGKHLLKDAIEGEWVGQLDIDDDQSDTTTNASPHRQAAIHFKLEMDDIVMKRYKGPGEVFIAGESRPREIRMGNFGDSDDGIISVAIIGHPDVARLAHGYYDRSKPNVMTLTNDGDFDL